MSILFRSIRVNVEGARHVCMTASALNIRQIIFTSSVAVYGFVEQETDEGGVSSPSTITASPSSKEYVYEARRKADSANKLTIIRPTVVFGEGNRGNVYNLFRQIASGRFVMIGSGNNMKSMAYVENIAARLEHALDQQSTYQVSNYVDKPDFTMNQLVDVISSPRAERIRRFAFPCRRHMRRNRLDVVSKISRKNSNQPRQSAEILRQNAI